MNLQGTHDIAAECIFNASCIEALVVYILIQVPPPPSKEKDLKIKINRGIGITARTFLALCNIVRT